MLASSAKGASQVVSTKNVYLPSQLLEGTRQLSPPPLRPGQDEPFLPPRAIFQPLCGKERMSFDIPPRSRPLCLKTKFTTDVAGSLLGARRCDIMARPTCPSRGLVRLVRGGNVERLELHYVRRQVAKVHHDGRRSSRKNKRQCDLGRHVHGEPIDRPKHDLFYAPSAGLGVIRILREQERMRLGRTAELVEKKWLLSHPTVSCFSFEVHIGWKLLRGDKTDPPTPHQKTFALVDPPP